MKKVFFIIAAVILAAAIPYSILTTKAEKSDYTGPFFEDRNIDPSPISKQLRSLTLREKCAQMVMVHAYGSSRRTDVDKLEELVREGIGGVMFLSGTSNEQKKIADKLQSEADIPLLVSSDFERGPGMRLKDMPEFPYNMAIAAANDTNLTRMMGYVTGLLGRETGVSQNFAPMVDLNDDPANPIVNIRAYSDDPFLTSVHAANFVKGAQQAHSLACLKHFPGHGTTNLDSHSELPVIGKNYGELEKADLYPYSSTFGNGVPAVMVGHLVYPELDDSNLPASLSHKIVTGLLKEQLGFKGLVFTDAMNMHSITGNYGDDDAVKMAVNAGNDVILFPRNGKEAIDAIEAGVKSGEIEEAVIDSAVKKILTAKEWVKLYASEKQVEANKLPLFAERISRDIAEKSITLFRDKNNLVPFNRGNYKNVAVISLRDDYREDEGDFLFEKLFTERYPETSAYRINKSSRKKKYREAAALIKKNDLLIFPVSLTTKSFKGKIDIEEKQLELIKKAASAGKKVVVVSLGSPYFVKNLGNDITFMCAYGDVKVSQQAAFNAFTGETSITGKLPVNIPETELARGDGIQKPLHMPLWNSRPEDTLYNFSEVNKIMEEGVSDKVFPGAVLIAGNREKVLYHKAFGKYTYEEEADSMTTGSLFDLASLTKVIGTTSAAMVLYDRGELSLDKRVAEYLPEFGNNGKENITVRQLLLHRSGLPPFKRYYKMYDWKQEAIDDIMKLAPDFKPGSDYSYSDLGMITMQLIIEKITGEGIDSFLQREVFSKLDMNSTMYNPPAGLIEKCVPTEVDNYWRNTLIQGKVHDENAYLLGGVAGHAGLFSTAGDLSHMAYTLLNGGSYKGDQIFRETTVKEWTRQYADNSSRATGWGTNANRNTSAGKKLSPEAFGHTGFTGTSIWIDPVNGIYVILLTNRVHPTRENRKITEFRPELHDALYEALVLPEVFYKK